MKKLKLLCLVILIAMNATGQVDFDTYLNNGMYTFDDVFKATRSEIFSTYKSQFGLTSYDEIELVDEQYIKVDSTDTIRTGLVHSLYRQKHKGYSVEHKTMHLASKCDVVLLASGSIAKNLDIDDAQIMLEEDALDEALANITTPIGFTWENAVFLDSLILITEDTSGNYDSSITTYPEGSLVISFKYGEDVEDIPENYALCWKFSIGYYDTITKDSTLVDTTWVYNKTDTFINNRIVYVKASDGSIWNSYDPAKYAYMASGNVWTPHNGHRYDIKTKHSGGGRYKLSDLDHNIAAWYVDAYGDPTEKYSKRSNNNWVGFYEKEPATAYWAVQKSIEYFKWRQHATFPRAIHIYTNSKAVKSRIGALFYATREGDFNKNSSEHEIHVAPGMDYISSNTLEMLGHEVAHVVNYERGKLGHGISDAHEANYIDEGFADVFGVAIHHWIMGSTDWAWFNDGFFGNKYQRSMQNPLLDYFPSGVTSSAAHYSDGNATNAQPHSGGGLVRKWFTHLSQGEWNWSPPYSGVGFNTASDISFLTYYWVVNNTTVYSELANATLAVAAMHYGGICSPVWKKVKRAWDDVGVATPFVSCLRYQLVDRGVIKQEDNPGPAMGYFLVRSNGGGFGEEEPEDDIISYSWSLPAHWTGTFSNDNDMFTLTDVDDDYSSQEYSVIVEYVPEGLVDTVYDTLKSVIHFSAFCTGQESGAKPGRPTNISTKITTLSDVKVYPNPTDKHLVIEGASQGTTVQLFNLVGQEVLQSGVTKSMETINTSQLIPGVYILSLTDAQGNKDTRRIVKQ